MRDDKQLFAKGIEKAAKKWYNVKKNPVFFEISAVLNSEREFSAHFAKGDTV